jgi:hypothetical protein
MGVWERQRQVRQYRGQMPSPGRPPVAVRDDRVRFWAAIARGVKTEDAGSEAGVSMPVAFRWFRHAGGVDPCLPSVVSGRYLSFAEREDIAIWRAQVPTKSGPHVPTRRQSWRSCGPPTPGTLTFCWTTRTEGMVLL